MLFQLRITPTVQAPRRAQAAQPEGGRGVPAALGAGKPGHPGQGHTPRRVRQVPRNVERKVARQVVQRKIGRAPRAGRVRPRGLLRVVSHDQILAAARRMRRARGAGQRAGLAPCRACRRLPRRAAWPAGYEARGRRHGHPARALRAGRGQKAAQAVAERHFRAPAQDGRGPARVGHAVRRVARDCGAELWPGGRAPHAGRPHHQAGQAEHGRAPPRPNVEGQVAAGPLQIKDRRLLAASWAKIGRRVAGSPCIGRNSKNMKGLADFGVKSCPGPVLRVPAEDVALVLIPSMRLRRFNLHDPRMAVFFRGNVRNPAGSIVTYGIRLGVAWHVGADIVAQRGEAVGLTLHRVVVATLSSHRRGRCRPVFKAWPFGAGRRPYRPRAASKTALATARARANLGSIQR